MEVSLQPLPWLPAPQLQRPVVEVQMALVARVAVGRLRAHPAGVRDHSREQELGRRSHPVRSC